jgi:hypothetical protein
MAQKSAVALARYHAKGHRRSMHEARISEPITAHFSTFCEDYLVETITGSAYREQERHQEAQKAESQRKYQQTKLECVALFIHAQHTYSNSRVCVDASQIHAEVGE